MQNGNYASPNPVKRTQNTEILKPFDPYIIFKNKTLKVVKKCDENKEPVATPLRPKSMESTCADTICTTWLNKSMT